MPRWPRRTTCKDCDAKLPAFGRRTRCRKCQRALWRETRRKYTRPSRPSRAQLREEAAAIERRFQAALRAIKAQRRSVEVRWKSQAALMVEAA